MESFEQIILLLVSGQGILLSFALLTGIFKKNYSNFFLGLITIVITLEILHIWSINMGYQSSEHLIPFWLFGSYLIAPPATWFFLKSNTNSAFQPKIKDLLLFLPAIIEVSSELSLFYGNKIFGTDYHLARNSVWYTFTEKIPVIAITVILLFFIKELKQMRTSIKKNQTTKGNYKQLSKLYFFLLTFLLITFFWFLVAVFDFKFYYIIEIILLLFIFILGYLTYFSPTFNIITENQKTDVKKEKFPQFNDEKELDRLKVLFENEKIFRQQKLSLNEVATTLNLPERYISKLINTHHNTNFSSFVNNLRVADAISRIKNPKERNKSILGIALDSGFSSKSAFNSTFKNVTGKNPSDFLKE